MKTLLALTLFLTWLSPAAFADEQKAAAEEKAPPPKVKMIYRKSESHQFSGANLKGKLKKPELSYIYERKGLKEEQIVNVPDNFNAEIIRDTEHL